eukprot:scpid27618/ scgid19425/ Mannosyl-oligosaccharide 1,2-alpha-mannosidase IA; Man(9)-alpha-mannosidase; Mannosidase alpha class 1A member 1; Processing alpha-1,2-mannosidase IA
MGKDAMRLRGTGMPRRRVESGFCPSPRTIIFVLALVLSGYVFTHCLGRNRGKCAVPMFLGGSPERTAQAGAAEKEHSPDAAAAPGAAKDETSVEMAANKIDQLRAAVKTVPPELLKTKDPATVAVVTQERQPSHHLAIGAAVAAANVKTARAEPDLASMEDRKVVPLHQLEPEVTRELTSAPPPLPAAVTLAASTPEADTKHQEPQQVHEQPPEPESMTAPPSTATAAPAQAGGDRHNDKAEEVDIHLVKQVQDGTSTKRVHVEADDKLPGDPRGDSKDPLPGQERTRPVFMHNAAAAGVAGNGRSQDDEHREDAAKNLQQPTEKHDHLADEDKEDTHKWHYVGSETENSDDKKPLPTIPPPAGRLPFVKQMIRTAWQSYVKSAWGMNHLDSVQGRGDNEDTSLANIPLGLSLVEALDTLYIANMTEEFRKGRAWVANNLSFANAEGKPVVSQLSKRFLGSLLSVYALTGDKVFLSKAVQLGNILLQAVDPSSGLARREVILSRVKPNTPAPPSPSECLVLAEVGGLHLELTYLSQASGNPRYQQTVSHIRHYLSSKFQEALPGIPYSRFHLKREQPTAGKLTDTPLPKLCNGSATVAGDGDEYFNHLAKSTLLSPPEPADAGTLVKALDTIRKLFLRKLSFGNTSYTYVTTPEHSGDFNQSTCYVGTVFALASIANTRSAGEYLKLAEDIANTCRMLQVKSDFNLGVESVAFSQDAKPSGKLFAELNSQLSLRSEVAELYFVLSRITGKKQYKTWAIEMAQAIDECCRLDGGFTVRTGSKSSDLPNKGNQPSHLLGATLKFLYLTFTEDSVMSLKKWVFSSAGHALPRAALPSLAANSRRKFRKQPSLNQGARPRINSNGGAVRAQAVGRSKSLGHSVDDDGVGRKPLDSRRLGRPRRPQDIGQFQMKQNPDESYGREPHAGQNRLRHSEVAEYNAVNRRQGGRRQERPNVYARQQVIPAKQQGQLPPRDSMPVDDGRSNMEQNVAGPQQQGRGVDDQQQYYPARVVRQRNRPVLDGAARGRQPNAGYSRYDVERDSSRGQPRMAPVREDSRYIENKAVRRLEPVEQQVNQPVHQMVKQMQGQGDLAYARDSRQRIARPALNSAGGSQVQRRPIQGGVDEEVQGNVDRRDMPGRMDTMHHNAGQREPVRYMKQQQQQQ